MELPADFEDGWTAGSHLGLTASTGELSDNHDVIRVETYIDSKAAEKGEQRREQATPGEMNTVRQTR